MEMATGQPLFPGSTDADQLDLIALMVGSLSPEQMARVWQVSQVSYTMYQRSPSKRNTLEYRFPRLTRNQMHFVKVRVTTQPPCMQH